MKSIEEKIEDWAKRRLDKLNIAYYGKTDEINSEIGSALKNAESKSGGMGGNRPDIQVLLKTKTNRLIPVMIEVKGSVGALAKMQGTTIANTKKDGTPDFAAISKYAVNGAVHYALAIIENTESYKEVIAIGLNGFEEGGKSGVSSAFTISATRIWVCREKSTTTPTSIFSPPNIWTT